MPKAPRKSTARSARTSPTTARARTKDPKASHLYTDDNPATTLHGTGFKDASAAQRTLSLIQNRSLTYQWQTVNTMYHRARHHPAMAKAGADTRGMRAAMDVFRAWLDGTYPAAKERLRAAGFKPVLGKDVVARYLGRIQDGDGDGDGDGAGNVVGEEEARRFAGVYVALAKGKKLANVLVDEGRPEGRDWEVARYQALDSLVPEGKEVVDGWEYDELWVKGADGKAEVTETHLALIAWAWSPVKARELVR